MYNYSGSIHIHSTFSDGTAKPDEIAKYANEVGLRNILESLRQFEKDYGERFTPSNLLVKLVENYEDFETGEALWKH